MLGPANSNGHSRNGYTTSDAVELFPVRAENDWGIANGYWLWPTTIKILFVIDGRVTLAKDNGFGLGFVLDTLFTPFAWWVRFNVDIAKRDGDLPAHLLDERHLSYTDFKFTNAGFDFDSYDQVWLFGDLPFSGEFDGGTDDEIEGPFALDDAELKLLAEWMDRGGGVFATGDHNILGASLCSRIPRVRTMRRWTYAQSAPAQEGFKRNSTVQLDDAGGTEGDSVLQPVELVFQLVNGHSPLTRPLIPHPVLCSALGAIDRFPDHMHEGEVFADRDVLLDRPLNIPGYDRPEYPFMPRQPGRISPRRPRPHVIGFGRTTNKRVADPVNTSRLTFGGVDEATTEPFGPKDYGLVGVYDGDPVSLGRVVVDSTWHHWFSGNLEGIVADSTPAYPKMQAYYRNIGLWLATPAQRQSMLISSTWGVLTGSAPMKFGPNDNPWFIGEQVLAVLGQTASPCIIKDFVDATLGDNSATQLPIPIDLHPSEPFWSVLSPDLVNRAVVGGIGSALVELALNHRDKRNKGERPRLDAEAIRERSIEGLNRGRVLLAKTIEDATTAFNTINSNLAALAYVPAVEVCIPINTYRITIKGDKLQFPDPRDPELSGRDVTFTIRVTLDDMVVAQQIFENVTLPPFDSRGSIIDLKGFVADLEVHDREVLSIAVLAGRWSSREASPQDVRFRATINGAASNWIGTTTPAASQLWRLWYSIEKSSASPTTEVDLKCAPNYREVGSAGT